MGNGIWEGLPVVPNPSLHPAPGPLQAVESPFPGEGGPPTVRGAPSASASAPGQSWQGLANDSAVLPTSEIEMSADGGGTRAAQDKERAREEQAVLLWEARGWN